MLKTRVLPVVLLTGYNVVKSIKFSTYRTLGNPITVSRVYDSRGVDELVLLDIRATLEDRGPSIDIISDISGECFMPLTVGGGIKTIEQARQVVRHGADKVAINTAAIERPALISELNQEFGAQCVVVSIDVKMTENDGYRVCSRSGKKLTDLDPVAWAKEAERFGAGEILLNSVDRDGEMKGYDLELVRLVTKAVKIPVVACGGAGKLEDFAAVIQKSGASAAAAASIFHFTSVTPRQAKESMRDAGIPVRL